MKKLGLLILAITLFSMNAFAQAQGEICKGTSSKSIAFTIAVSDDNSQISVNALGKRVTYDVKEPGGGDDYYEYASTNDELKVTFYDQGSSCSGSSTELGKFSGEVTNEN
jgi:hypothetical protein